MIESDLPGGQMPRRTFQLAVIYVLGALISLALAIPTIIYLFVPPRARKQSGWVDAGDISGLTPGSPVEMSFQQSRVDGWRVVTEKKTAWVVKTPDNHIVAYGPHCTHLGCAYHWDESLKQFACPCHSSFFSIQGAVLAGPAPRPLDRYTTQIRNNRLQVGPLKPVSGSNA
ncbi:MAG: Rieske 2Fe-2S domain-containing protein [Acidobacteriota bacterium]|nr:Rieske 2Fe-2S domain-containing protein [Acidobacteriota bacterium]